MRQPWLIQRCLFRDDRIVYDYMGSTEFEVGDQARSLKRIFAAGMTTGSANISVGGKEISVYMVASGGFTFSEYQPYLQQLAEGGIRLQELTYFDDLVEIKIGIPTDRSYIPKVDAWFDFENDVLWTLTEENQKKLLEFLENIKKKWAEKN